MSVEPFKLPKLHSERPIFSLRPSPQNVVGYEALSSHQIWLDMKHDNSQENSINELPSFRTSW